MHLSPRRTGFTLVELSIVLVLISLIVGGVLGAQTLVLIGKQSAIIKESQQYLQAVQTFRMKYRFLPGDFTGATARWNNIETTQNGDGDGVLETNAGGVNETQRTWQHLRLAGILADYPYSGSSTLTPGSSLPASHGFPDTAFQLMGNVTVFTVNRGNALLFGKRNTATGADYTYGALLAKYAVAIDEKIDDGRADGGMALGVSGQENTAAAGCTDKKWDAAAPASYTPSDTTKYCYLVFLMQKDKF